MQRIEREKSVVALMIDFYCRHQHGRRDGLCEECARLRDYASARLDRCPHGNAKPSCRKCSIHCYAPAGKESIRKVMRYVGPRMLFIHPVAAVRHLFDELH